MSHPNIGRDISSNLRLWSHQMPATPAFTLRIYFRRKKALNSKQGLSSIIIRHIIAPPVSYNIKKYINLNQVHIPQNTKC